MRITQFIQKFERIESRDSNTRWKALSPDLVATMQAIKMEGPLHHRWGGRLYAPAI